MSLAEFDAAGDLARRFVHATRVNVPDFMIRDGSTYRILADHLGSPRLVIDTATGAVVQRLDFDEWGIVMQDTNPGWMPFGFAGGLYEPASGLVRFGARDFEATSGRWTSKDPIGFVAGETDLLGYSGNDPTNRSDPSGLASYFFGGQVCVAGPGGGLNLGLGFAFNFGLNGERLDFGVYSSFGVAMGLEASGTVVGGHVDGNVDNLRGGSSSTGVGLGPFGVSTLRDPATGDAFGAFFAVGPSAPFLNGALTRDETQLFNLGLLADLIRGALDTLFGPDDPGPGDGGPVGCDCAGR